MSSPTIEAWRRDYAIALGFDTDTAAQIAEQHLVVGETPAEDCGVDLHKLEALIARGCPRELALRIV